MSAAYREAGRVQVSALSSVCSRRPLGLFGDLISRCHFRNESVQETLGFCIEGVQGF